MSGVEQGPGFLFKFGAGTGTAEVDGEPGERAEGSGHDCRGTGK